MADRRSDLLSPRDSFALASPNAAVRSFGAHESDGVWAIYAGVGPTGILQGIWSPTGHTLVFNPVPELSGATPGSPGLKTQKVTGFADCGGALYVTINTKLFRRNDGSLPDGSPAMDTGRSGAAGGSVQQRAAGHIVRLPRKGRPHCSSRRRAAVMSTGSITFRPDSCLTSEQ